MTDQKQPVPCFAPQREGKHFLRCGGVVELRPGEEVWYSDTFTWYSSGRYHQNRLTAFDIIGEWQEPEPHPDYKHAKYIVELLGEKFYPENKAWRAGDTVSEILDQISNICSRLIRSDLPHDYDLIRRERDQFESELRAAEELNRRWDLDYQALKEERNGFCSDWQAAKEAQEKAWDEYRELERRFGRLQAEITALKAKRVIRNYIAPVYPVTCNLCDQSPCECHLEPEQPKPVIEREGVYRTIHCDASGSKVYRTYMAVKHPSSNKYFLLTYENGEWASVDHIESGDEYISPLPPNGVKLLDVKPGDKLPEDFWWYGDGAWRDDHFTVQAEAQPNTLYAAYTEPPVEKPAVVEENEDDSFEIIKPKIVEKYSMRRIVPWKEINPVQFCFGSTWPEKVGE